MLIDTYEFRESQFILTDIGIVNALHSTVLYDQVSLDVASEPHTGVASLLRTCKFNALVSAVGDQTYHTIFFLHISLPRRMYVHLDRVSRGGQVVVFCGV
jgi:hypothetical protein